MTHDQYRTTRTGLAMPTKVGASGTRYIDPVANGWQVCGVCRTGADVRRVV